MDRRQLKQTAKQTLKKHYLLLTALCFTAAILGAEFLSLPTTDKLYYQSLIESFQNISTSGFKAIGMAFYNLIGANSSSSISTQVYYHILGMFSSRNTWVILSSLAGILGFLLVCIFFKQTLCIILRRMFLEARSYDTVPLQHVFFLNSAKKWFRASIALLRTDIYYLLWCLTIVGGVIKRYSYLMVPYILAENPNMSGEQAVRLSRDIMDGHKKEAFFIDLSMIGWHLLNLLTFGLAGIFYVNAYQTSVFAEYYAAVRAEEKKKQIANIDLLNDTYLFVKADPDTLAAAYKTVKMDTMYIHDTKEPLQGARRFFAETLSIWTGNHKQRKIYQGVRNLSYQLSLDQNALDGKQYPDRLSPFYTKENIHYDGNLNEQRAYTIENMILIFFIGSVLGWIFKCMDYFVFTNSCVNAGMFHGPWVPMYGLMGILCLTLLTKLRKKPIAEFIGCLIIAAAVLLCSSYYLQAMYGMAWWDFSTHIISFGGRVSLQNTIYSAFVCMFFIHLILPALDQWLSRRKTSILYIIDAILIVLLIIDAVYSFTNPNTAGVLKETGAVIQSLIL
ncbi:MAG: DUF975 family protein [Erysipelotrichaceae bacterium]|nr:DUF975 family protein [Erysipelotrichaceae bacterium]